MPDAPNMNAVPVALVAAPQLKGTLISNFLGKSWHNAGNDPAKALDNNLNTFADAPDAAAGYWIGLDLGTACQISQIQFAPRVGFAGRMQGGVFQGSNSADFASAATLAVITQVAPGGTLTILNPTDKSGYRYVRYVGPVGSYCNVAELKWFGSPAASSSGEISVSSTQYVSATGDDRADGQTPATALRHPKFASSTRVLFNGGDKFDPLNLSLPALKDVILDSCGNGKAIIYGTAGGNLLSMAADARNIALNRLIFDSAPNANGTGVANVGHVRGSNIQINDCWLGHVWDGFEFDDVTGLVIRGGGQLAPKTVDGRNLFFFGVTDADVDGWAGLDSAAESTFRWSNYCKGGKFANLSAIGNPAKNGKACFAIHTATGTIFQGLKASGCGISFDSAGEGGSPGATDTQLIDCRGDNCKLEFKNGLGPGISVTRYTGINPGGEVVAMATDQAIAFSGLDLTSDSPHFFSFYAKSASTITGCTGHSKNKQIQWATGSFPGFAPNVDPKSNTIVYL